MTAWPIMRFDVFIKLVFIFDIKTERNFIDDLYNISIWLGNYPM